MAESQFAAHFSVWGRLLDVDAILVKAKPHRHSVWRRGEPAEIPGLQQHLAGFSVFPGGTRAARIRAVGVSRGGRGS